VIRGDGHGRLIATDLRGAIELRLRILAPGGDEEHNGGERGQTGHSWILHNQNPPDKLLLAVACCVAVRRPLLVVLVFASACGDDAAVPVDAAIDARIDAPQGTCQSQGAIGQFIRRAGNPRVLPGTTFTDGKLDIHIADPDVHWDQAAQRWVAYWAAGHGMNYTDPAMKAVIRRAESADRMTWTLDDAPVFSQATGTTAWDRVNTETPTVIYNPAAPPSRRYLMLYSGSDDLLVGGSKNYQIGAAFSADGKAFTRVSAVESPHGKEGLVLTGKQVYPTGTDGVVADPDLALVDGIYHLFFSSFSCSGANCGTAQTFGVAHATSADGITWTIKEAPVRSLLKTSALTSGGQQPSVIYDSIHCRWEMWLRSDAAADVAAQPIDFNNMAGVYKAESTDGENWNVNYAFNRDLAWAPMDPNGGGEDLGLLTGADVAMNGNGRLMLYVGFDDDNVPAGFALPNRSPPAAPNTARSGVFTLNVATRDLP